MIVQNFEIEEVYFTDIAPFYSTVKTIVDSKINPYKTVVFMIHNKPYYGN